MKKVICPKCGKEANKAQTKYGIRNHCCDVWSWGHHPMVDRKTHKARRKAHENFDVLWKSGLLSRTDAYKWLAKALKISQEKCHMKQMDYETAKKVVTICRNFKKLM